MHPKPHVEAALVRNGFRDLSGEWQPGRYVEMVEPVFVYHDAAKMQHGFVKVARPMGVKCALIVAIVDKAIVKMIRG